MDLEQLTKHQVVLLTLLVSFVTSIATGIVTVSLMNQAPPYVTRTINQIVERTVQTIVPSKIGQVVSTVKTIVVKDDDLAAQSISSVQKSVVRIMVRGEEELLARGVIIDSSGTALTDKQSLSNSGYVAFDAILSDGTRVPVSIHNWGDASMPVLAVSVAVGTSTGFAPIKFADLSKLRLGQSVIRVGGRGTDVIGIGIIAALHRVAKTGNPSSIETNVPSTIHGSVLTTLFGEVVGITTSDSLTESSYLYSAATYPVSPIVTKPTLKQ